MEFGTVSHRTSVLSKSLNSALETFTFGNCSCVDLVAFCKDISFDHITQVVLSCVLKFELFYKSLSGYTSFCKMSHLSFVNTMSVSDFFLSVCILVDNSFFLVSKCNLYCTVSIVLNSFDLCH